MSSTGKNYEKKTVTTTKIKANTPSPKNKKLDDQIRALMSELSAG